MSSRFAMDAIENNDGNYDQSGEMLKGYYFDLKELPAGYKFCPTDYELVVEYLRQKINKVPSGRRHLHIKEVNIYKYNPMQLSDMYKLENETEWYFFTPRFKRYTNGSRPGRDAHGGYWKPTETKAPVRDDQHNRTVGFKQTLAFHLGHDRSKNNKKTDWRMHEYTLTKNSNPVPNRRKLDEWVLVKIYKKRGKTKKEGKAKNAVAEFGPANNSGDAESYYDQIQIPQPPQTISRFVEMLNQASILPPFPSPMVSLPPIVELQPFPQQLFFNGIGHYKTPNYGLCMPFGPQLNQNNQLSGPPPQHPHLNQMNQASGPLPQQTFGLNEATNLEPPNFGQFNLVSDNGMQLQQQIVGAEAQPGECCNNQVVLGGCQSGDLGLRNDPSFRTVIEEEEDSISFMDLLCADEVSLTPQHPKDSPPWQ